MINALYCAFLTGVIMRKHKYKVLLMSAIICGCLLVPLYIVTFTLYGEYLFDIFLRAALIITLALFVLIVYMHRHKKLMLAEFNHTAAVRLSYIQRRAAEAPDAFRAADESVFGGAKSIDADLYTIPLKYLYRLFLVDAEPWNYTTYVALDIRDGKPYRMIKKTLTQKNVYGADLHTRLIDYDEVRRLALRVRKDTDYSQLSESTWESFIPEDKRYTQETPADNRLDISAAEKSASAKLTRFYFESKEKYKSHIVVYLRQTDKGTALFSAEASDGTIGLRFEFDFTEQMIEDIFNQKYGNKLYANDRLLTEKEAAFVQAIAADDDNTECQNPENVVCYSVADGLFDDGKTAAKQKLAEVLAKLARYGSK